MSNDWLVVVDAQNDFVDGALGTTEAVEAMRLAVQKARDFEGTVVFTQDTHSTDYLGTQEGSLLPVEHCLKGTHGWQLIDGMEEVRADRDAKVFEKPTFASIELAEMLSGANEENPIDSIELIGLCTDICVVSNALVIKGFLPGVPVKVDPSCCAATTPENHKAALDTMMSCQVLVEE